MDSEQPSTSKASQNTHATKKKGDKAQAKATGTQPGEHGTLKRFVVTKFEAKAIWAWDINVDTCAICRNSLMDQCIDCQSNPDIKRECNIAWGICNHAYHVHCIGRWTQTRNVCPLDNTPWSYKMVGN